jgi:hypothetical protein
VRDLVGEGAGGGQAVDQPPRHHDPLVAGARPFEIGDGDLAVHALMQGVEEFRRGQPDDIAFALQRLLVGVHGVGHVHGDHQLDIHIGLDRTDRRPGRTLGSSIGHRRPDRHYAKRQSADQCDGGSHHPG